jgi:hypothetical protein
MLDCEETKLIVEALTPINGKIRNAYVVLMDPCGSVVRVEDRRTGKTGPSLFIHEAEGFFAGQSDTSQTELVLRTFTNVVQVATAAMSHDEFLSELFRRFDALDRRNETEGWKQIIADEAAKALRTDACKQ